MRLTGTLRGAGLALLCALWMALGLVGHDPWKPDEASTFGVVYEMLQGSGWVVPRLAGEPALDRPPLFAVVAATLARAASGRLAPHDGARLATFVFVGITLIVLARTGRQLYGKGFGWLPVLVLLGCLGFVDRAHLLFADTALLAGLACATYGLALAPTRAAAGGLLLGTGTGLAFMAKGAFGPAVVLAVAILLPAFREWRRAAYARALLIALPAAAPWLLAWPIALASQAPDLFHAWLDGMDPVHLLADLPGSAAGDALYYARQLPWFAWPALPLALWTMWACVRGWQGGFARPGVQLPLLLLAVTFAGLVIAGDTRAALTMPLLLPLALLGAAGVDTLPRGLSGALDWFGILTFGLAALALWLAWGALLAGWPPALADRIADYQPAFRARVSWPAVAIAAFVSVLWFALVRPAKQSQRRVALNWTAGTMLVWGIAMTLWLPFIDIDKSYRGVARELARVLPPGHGCVASRQLGEPQRAMLHYFGGLRTVREERDAAHTCEWLLVQAGPLDPESAGPRWRRAWEGSRPGERSERFRLYRREGTS